MQIWMNDWVSEWLHELASEQIKAAVGNRLASCVACRVSFIQYVTHRQREVARQVPDVGATKLEEAVLQMDGMLIDGRTYSFCRA